MLLFRSHPTQYLVLIRSDFSRGGAQCRRGGRRLVLSEKKARRGTEIFQRELRYEQRQVARPEQERRRLASLYQFDSKACSWCGLLVQSNRIIFGERRQFFHGLAPLVSAKRYPSAMPDNRIIPLQRHLVPGGPSQLRARYPPIWATSVMASLNRSG